MQRTPFRKTARHVFAGTRRPWFDASPTLAVALMTFRSCWLSSTARDGCPLTIHDTDVVGQVPDYAFRICFFASTLVEVQPCAAVLREERVRGIEAWALGRILPEAPDGDRRLRTSPTMAA